MEHGGQRSELSVGWLTVVRLHMPGPRFWKAHSAEFVGHAQSRV